MTREEILQTVLDLPEQDRMEILAKLIDSLDESVADPDHAEAWVAELKRRLAEIDSGSAKLMNWSEVRARIEERLRTGR